VLLKPTDDQPSGLSWQHDKLDCATIAREYAQQSTGSFNNVGIFATSSEHFMSQSTTALDRFKNICRHFDKTAGGSNMTPKRQHIQRIEKSIPAAEVPDSRR
jgi:hypothetical protein